MLVRGENVVLEIYDDGEWKILACARSCNLTIDTDLIETSTTGTGVNRTFLPTANTFGGSFEGLVNLDQPDLITMDNLITLQLSHTLLLTRFVFTDTANNFFIFSGAFYITNISTGGGLNDAANFSVQVKGTGVPSTSTTPPTPIITAVVRYEFTTSANQVTLTDVALIGKDIIEAFIGPTPLAPILTSGTPIANEGVYDSATGSLTWANAADAGMECYIVYQNI